MTTITRDEYVALNEVHRSGYVERARVPMFERLRARVWIEPFRAPHPFADTSDEWQLSSAGRLEHNLYEKKHNVTDGLRRKSHD